MNRKKKWNAEYVRLLCVLCVLCGKLFVWFPIRVTADVYTINTKAQWSTWKWPKGVVHVTEEGEVQLTYIRKGINAAANAGEFVHRNAKGEEVRGGIGSGGSGLRDGPNILDGDPSTYWKPSEGDVLKDWWIGVDLGRVVSATKIRLVFPDTPDARPFEQFTVYVSPGIRPVPGEDMFKFEVAGRTTKPNTEQVVEYELAYEQSTDPRGTPVPYALDALPVQYIDFVAHAKTPNAALVEMEVEALGDNIALGTLQRGGSWVPGAGSPNDAVFDGDMHTWSQIKILTEQEWESGGAYFVWDLGALFWVDQIQVLGAPRGWAGTRLGGWVTYLEGYLIRTSDGSKTPAGHIDYETIIDVDNNAAPNRYFFKHVFPPRRIRYVFFRHAHGGGMKDSRGGGGANIHEIQFYGQGTPCGATLESDLIDLGALAGDGKPKNIAAIQWIGHTPSDTRIEIRTSSGDALREEARYYDQGGKEITRAKWEKTPKSRRGPKEVTWMPGSDWSDFSPIYRHSGDRFLSPSPRRYLRFQIQLLSDDPEAAPSLSALSIEYVVPLLKQVLGWVEPQSVVADRDTLFTYSIVPVVAPGDPGYDRVLIRLPCPLSETGRVALNIDGRDMAPDSVYTSGDSLFVELPVRIRRQHVDLLFPSRVLPFSTVFEAFVGNSERPTAWQRVDPAERGATTVSVPSLAESSDLIGNLLLQPRTITPNGDGCNDEMTIRFSVLKVEKIPEVTIHDLQGEVIKKLTVQDVRSEGQPTWKATWDGRNAYGDHVHPGLYLCRIHLPAQAGHRTVARTIGVIY